jgi:hypothetical protein
MQRALLSAPSAVSRLVAFSRHALPSASPSARAASRGLFIKIETTPNPDSLKFRPEDREVLPPALGSGLHFATAADAASSRLVRALLKYPQITGVFFGRDFISVNKQEDARWDALKPIVLARIMDAFADLDAKGEPLVSAPRVADDTAPSADDSEVVSMIKELIETRIRPAVQEDGGDIFFVCVWARWMSSTHARGTRLALNAQTHAHLLTHTHNRPPCAQRL